MDTPRLTRCLRLLNLLQSRVGFNTLQLAGELEVSRRTVFRDLRVLEQAGIPCYYDHERGGYAVERAFRVDGCELTGDELVSLLLAAYVSSLCSCQGMGRIVNQAIAKVLNRMPATLREEAAALLSTTEIHSNTDKQSQDQLLRILLAIRQGRPLRVTLKNGCDPSHSQRTKITPHSLTVANGSWALVGRCAWHRKVCRLDLRHIECVETIAETVATSRGDRSSPWQPPPLPSRAAGRTMAPARQP